MYENRHARFTAVDPLLASGKSANPQTFNRYVYVLNNPLIFTDSSGMQAGTPTGKWYRPREPDGVKTYTYSSSQPEGYDEVTERNNRGELIGPGIGLDNNQIVRFNPLGPGGYTSVSNVFLDIMFGPIGGTPYNQNGYDFIRTDEAQAAYMRTGAIENAIEPFDVALALTPAGKGGTSVAKISGSGPASGIIEVSERVKSVGAFKNYSPKNGTEFIFDTEKNIFVVGRNKFGNSMVSPHQRLVDGIGSVDGKNILGGIFKRGENREIITNEFSGHFWQNWTPQNRRQFTSFLEDMTGQPVRHNP